MRNIYSLIACFFISAILLQHRLCYPGVTSQTSLKITDWDALGYYIYLPAIFIYHDIHELKWFEEVDKKYQVSGGNFYQAQKLDNGDHVFGYVGGVALMESPFFFIAHMIAPALAFSVGRQI